MTGLKYEKRDVKGYHRTTYGIKRWVNPYKRRQLIRVDDGTKSRIKGGKAKKLIRDNDFDKKIQKILTDFSWDHLNQFSTKDLVKIAIERNLDPTYDWEWESNWIDKDNLIRIIRAKAEKKTIKNSLINFNKREIIHFADYTGYHTIQRDCKTKADLIEFMSSHTHDYIIDEYIRCRDKIKGFSNDKKFIIRSLRDKTYITDERIKKLVGVGIFEELKRDQLVYIQYKGGNDNNKYYVLTGEGRRYIDNFDHLYKDVVIPNYDSMIKVISPEIMNSVKQLAKSRREYSIGLDFERELKNPQQIVAIQGAETFTYHLYDDFEMFGHTHPSREDAIPSKNDLINMAVGKPEFIVAGKTGKAIIMNLENEESYRKWKKDPYFPSWFNLNKKEDRDKYFRDTGIRIYPYKKGMKVTLIDDPRLEKGFPFFSTYSLDKIHESERENLSRQTAKADIGKQKKNKQPLSKKDQTVRWMRLTSDQLKKELHNPNKYPDVESIKIASESLLNRNEMKLKTREKVIKIVVKRMGEEKAIASLGR